MSKKRIILLLFLTFFNLIILSAYFYNFDLSKNEKLYDLLIILIFYCLFTFCTFYLKNIFFNKINLFQISLFIILLFFSSMEIVYKINPKLFPYKLRDWIIPVNENLSKKLLVEYFDESPYVKFKPNTTIRNILWRGTNEQFVYEWKTDKQGFKNSQDIAKLDKVKIVAVGNSFTEGMGVKTSDTWPSQLSKKRFATYNLGVQGYATSQMLGTLKKYGLKLNPDYVIIGYLKGSYAREKKFFDVKKTLEQKDFTGIGQLAKQNENHEIRNQFRFVTSALWVLTKGIRNNFNNLILFKSKLSDKKFKNYEIEMSIFKNIIDKDPKELKTWKSTLINFKNIKKKANQIGAKTIILYFPSRPQVYYSRAMGVGLENYNGKKELNLLKDFAKENNIMFIDPTNKLIKYVNNLEKDFKLRQLPYLEIDGHMNNIGYELIADEIVSILKK